MHEFYPEIEKTVKSIYLLWGRNSPIPQNLSEPELIELGKKKYQEVLRVPPEKFTSLLVYAYNLEDLIFTAKRRLIEDVNVRLPLLHEDQFVHRYLIEKALKIVSLPAEQAMNILALMSNLRTTLESAVDVKQSCNRMIGDALKQANTR